MTRMRKLAEIIYGPQVWIQNSYEEGAKVCLLGGLGKLLGCQPETIGDDDPEYQRLIRAIQEETGGFHDDVANWNDNPSTTFTEVARVVSAYDRLRMFNS